MSNVKVILGEAFNEMAKLPSGSIQSIITSPPWYTNKSKEADSMTDFRRNLFMEFTRLLKPHGVIFVDTFRWKEDRKLLGKLKESGAIHCNQSTILIATLDGADKGVKTIKAETSRIFRAVIAGQVYHHPAAFTYAIPKLCAELGSEQGDLLLDPFCGVGTVGVIAKMLGRDAILIDNSPNHCFIAERYVEYAASISN